VFLISSSNFKKTVVADCYVLIMKRHASKRYRILFNAHNLFIFVLPLQFVPLCHWYCADEGVYVDTGGRMFKNVILQWGELPHAISMHIMHFLHCFCCLCSQSMVDSTWYVYCFFMNQTCYMSLYFISFCHNWLCHCHSEIACIVLYCIYKNCCM